MKYLIWGYYGAGNLGDDLMLEILIDRIRGKDPASIITVKALDGSKLPKTVAPMELDKWLSQSRKKLYFNVPLAMARVAGRIKSCDVLIIGGGTIFTDKGNGAPALRMLERVAWLAKVLHKKIFVVGAGIDDLGQAGEKSLEGILAKVDYTCFRDKKSYEIAKRLCKNPEKIALGADLLYLEKKVITTMPRKKEGMLISAIDYFGRLQPDAVKREKLKEHLKELAVSFISTGEKITLVSMQKGAGEKDYEYLKEIMDELKKTMPKNMADIQMVHLENKKDAVEIFGKAKFVIGMRYHALVLASIFGVPFIGINHESKIGEICREFDMPSVDISSFIEHGIPEPLSLLNDKKIDGKLLDEDAELAENNFKFLGVLQ